MPKVRCPYCKDTIEELRLPQHIAAKPACRLADEEALSHSSKPAKILSNQLHPKHSSNVNQPPEVDSYGSFESCSTPQTPPAPQSPPPAPNPK